MYQGTPEPRQAPQGYAGALLEIPDRKTLEEQIVRITHIREIQCMSGTDVPALQRFFSSITRRNPSTVSLPRPTSTSVPDHSPHHVAQETVSPDGKHPFPVPRLLPAGQHDPAVVRLHVRMQLAEAREVRIVKQRLCRLVHPFEIQRLEDAPRIPLRNGSFRVWI